MIPNDSDRKHLIVNYLKSEKGKDLVLEWINNKGTANII